METLKSCLVILSVLIFANSGSAEVVEWQPCPLSDANTCTIHEVRVNPCPAAARRKPCRVREGNEASISFDYTANFSGDLQNTAIWPSPTGDLRFAGLPDSACTSTVCPAVSGTRQTYSYSLQLGAGYPIRDYNVRWKLSNSEGKDCCFMFSIKLTK